MANEFDDVLDEEFIDANIHAQDHPNDTDLREYECETCGRKDTLTELQAIQAGWDYPPFIGMWGVLSPRTCGNCMIDTTAYWAVVTTEGPVDISKLDERHQNTIKRIAQESADPLVEMMRKEARERIEEEEE